jgi:CubicO group peptidase (beta-lactamase class C family)
MPAHASTSRFNAKPWKLARFGVALCGLAVSVLGSAARADSNLTQVATSLDATMRQWMHEYSVPAAALAAMKDRTVVRLGYGGMDPAQPARIASLSKAITGVCIGRLIDEGRLSFTAPLATVLAGTFRKLGQPADPRFMSITIEQLLKHRAGLAREARGGPPAHDMTALFSRILATPLESDPGGGMVYSNIGYLTLGMVAQAVTGRDYERHCGAAALAPMQASGSLDPLLRQRAASGGWRVSAIDYAKFVQVFDENARVLGETSRQWQDALPGNPAYGLGTFVRRTVNGREFSHTGRVALRERGGAYTIKLDNGWTIVITFDGDARGSVPDLRRQLRAAVSGT